MKYVTVRDTASGFILSKICAYESNLYTSLFDEKDTSLMFSQFKSNVVHFILCFILKPHMGVCCIISEIHDSEWEEVIHSLILLKMQKTKLNFAKDGSIPRERTTLKCPLNFLSTCLKI